MGWVGVATLIATACYLLSRFPPSILPPDPVPPSAPVEPPSAEPRRFTVTKGATSNSAKSASNTLKEIPKALASNAPALEVPTLNLGSESNAESSSEAPAIQSGSASPAASNTTHSHSRDRFGTQGRQESPPSRHPHATTTTTVAALV